MEGTWPQEFAHHSSNSLELRAILLSLRLFAPFLKGKAVMVMTDNTTAVACLLRQGYYQSSLLMELSRSILTFSFRNKIILIPKHISGELNILADQGSRFVSHPYGVVPGSSVFQLATRPRQQILSAQASSGPVCHPTQYPSEKLRLPSPGPSGSQGERPSLD